MFSARIFILLISFIGRIYDYILTKMADEQRKKPLPEEVADIYDAERYQTYLKYTADQKKLRNKYKAINLIFDVIIIMSPMYAYFDKLCGHNPYLVFLATYMVIWVISTVIDTFASYEVTFGIMEKYGLNKKDLKEFVKDEVLNDSLGLILSVGLLEMFTFIGEHMNAWTSGFSIGYTKSILLFLAVVLVLYLFLCAAKGISYLALRKQYQFTPLEEGELKDKINKLQEGSKKKVKKIYVYNESKKTTTKNAFLLKLMWHREFGIADNFMNENAESELLAVLSHEIGHLKHKKNILNFIDYGIKAVMAAVVLLLMIKPDVVLAINAWVRTSFALQTNNYYLLFAVFSGIITPVFYLNGVFDAYRSRWEEYEADREAVKNGYGEDLIRTFKNLSSDELVNVNPHPFIEFVEYDHPGMYQRIKAIREESIR